MRKKLKRNLKKFKRKSKSEKISFIIAFCLILIGFILGFIMPFWFMDSEPFYKILFTSLIIGPIGSWSILTISSILVALFIIIKTSFEKMFKKRKKHD